MSKVQQSLEQENTFYKILLAQSFDLEQVEASIIKFDLPVKVASLARERTALIRENQLYQIELGQSIPGAKLQPDRIAKLYAARKELSSRAMVA